MLGARGSGVACDGTADKTLAQTTLQPPTAMPKFQWVHPGVPPHAAQHPVALVLPTLAVVVVVQEEEVVEVMVVVVVIMCWWWLWCWLWWWW